MGVRDNSLVVTVVSGIDETLDIQPACLVMIYGLDLGKKFNLDRPSLIIGRSSKCNIKLDQESVSRNHAKIVNTDNSIFIKDLGSLKGTYVNGQPIQEAKLQNGDRVEIGRTIFKLLSGGNIENAYHEEIYQLTTIDGLTQVYNKRHFLENLERELSRSRRYGRYLSLSLFNVDHFRQINDVYGHLAGDHVLKQIAMLVRNHIRREDFLARYGGEEFAIILPEIDRENAIHMAEKVRQLVESQQLDFSGSRVNATISIGVATADESINGSMDLIKKADLNLYQAKKQGRNRVVG